jgi:hypothetical protein
MVRNSFLSDSISSSFSTSSSASRRTSGPVTQNKAIRTNMSPRRLTLHLPPFNHLLSASCLSTLKRNLFSILHSYKLLSGSTGLFRHQQSDILPIGAVYNIPTDDHPTTTSRPPSKLRDRRHGPDSPPRLCAFGYFGTGISYASSWSSTINPVLR